jgi:hypothetical protein
MTKGEFYLKSIIAMAGNPNYVTVKQSEDIPDCVTHTLETEEILMDAQRLLSKTESEWNDAFDKEEGIENNSVNSLLKQAVECLDDIRKGTDNIGEQP